MYYVADVSKGREDGTIQKWSDDRNQDLEEFLQDFPEVLKELKSQGYSIFGWGT